MAGILRLVTRGDLDGLACAVIITTCEEVDWVRLVQPQQIVSREITITGNDILANLPYHPDAHLWFGKDLHTAAHTPPPKELVERYAGAPSSAAIAYAHYAAQHPELERYRPLLDAVNKLDSAQLTREDIEDPKGYILLGYTLDPRTGLGAIDDYFHVLLDGLKEEGLEAILLFPEVLERVERMREQDLGFRESTRSHSRLEGSVVVTDFRDQDAVPVGNRFLVYTLFPDADVSVRLQWGPLRERVVASVGRSILKRTCEVDIGELMARYGGGGHAAAGSCLLRPETADAEVAEIVAALKG